MAIYDNNGTTSYEIGKVYDNDGTTNYQIGKVYDNNGTTSSLIYNSQISLNDISYTGTMEKIDDGNGNWRVKLKSNGNLTFATDGEIDVFLVGGGAGANFYGGGGGGYTLTKKGVKVSATTYGITIGSGGTGSNLTANNGTATKAFGFTAAGGYGSTNSDWGSGGNGGGTGGNGGSGGGACLEWDHGWSYTQTAGGTDGRDAAAASSKAGGKGQKSKAGPNGETGSTREFGETSGTLYSTGGGGYRATKASNTANTGNGGNANNGTGCSGIVVIRNKRN